MKNEKSTKRRWYILLLCLVLLVVALVGLGRVAIYYAGATPFTYVPLEPGNIRVPTTRTLIWRDQSKLTTSVLEHWANHPLGEWQSEGKIAAPRALMGRFLLERDLDAANAYLTRVTPWGKAGSTWECHPEGDYDFTLAGLMPILFLFGDDPMVLYPQTREHLLNVLLPLAGGQPQIMVPRTLGLVRDTENHLLMTEGSRYLKNRWLTLHGSTLPMHNNVENGLEAWLLNFIAELRAAGLYEFNSIPYEGYTLTALLNLEAFGSDMVQDAARDLIDQLNWQYALGSLSFRRFPPFRRQPSHAGDTDLSGDRHVALIKTWISLMPGGPDNLTVSGSHHIAIWACWSPYRLPDEIARWVLIKPADYFIRMGHGPTSSPEIYSGGPGYLLSAGGVNRGRRSLLVARPITLILDDGVNDLTQVLHMAGPGTDYRTWNNTGVCRNFAVAGGPVQIPEDWTADAAGAHWKVYVRQSDLCVAVYSQANLGIISLTRSSNPQTVLEAVENVNADADTLLRSFQSPDGTRIDYDTDAPHNRWVIQQTDGHPADGQFDEWPLLEGEGVENVSIVRIERDAEAGER